MSSREREEYAQRYIRTVERAFVVGVELRVPASSKAEYEHGFVESMYELERLLATAGIKVVGRAYQRIPKNTGLYYVGKGKVRNLGVWCGHGSGSL